ncbi:MAG: hypothetical protein ACHQD9_09825, partial [Chitinophagales bacterium]
MVPEFEELISRIRKLYANDQKKLVAIIKDELKWDATFAATKDKLTILTEQALKKKTERERQFH